jgi:regulator of sigma E protease
MLANPAVSFIALLLGFGVLIFVHELGHFLVAKWVGIRCQQFAIGFGPAALAWRKGIGLRSQSTEAAYQQKVSEALKAEGKDPEEASEKECFAAADNSGLGETEYRLNYIPLGGYVKMLGQEDLDPAAQSSDPRAYNQKAIWKRFCVLSAGVVMNVIFGLLFFIIAFMMGVNFPTTQVGLVQPNSPAANAYAQGHTGEPTYRGLQVGDRITHIDGEKVTDFMGMKLDIALAPENASVLLGVQRGDQRLQYQMEPRVPDRGDMPTIGIGPMASLDVGQITAQGESLRQALGLTAKGAIRSLTLTQINGQTVTDYSDYHRRLIGAQGQPVQATFEGVIETAAGAQEQKRVQVELAARPLLTRDGYGQQQDGPPANLVGFVPPVQVSALPLNENNEPRPQPAYEAGVRVGDLIASIGGVTWPTTEQLLELVKNAGNQALPLTVMRDGRLKSLGRVKPEDGEIGIRMSGAPNVPIIGQTLAGSPASRLALPGGTRVVELAGKPIGNWADMQRVLGQLDAESPPRTVDIRYRLNLAQGVEETGQLSLSGEQLQHLQAAGWATAPAVNFKTLQEPVAAGNPVEAAVMGVQKTNDFIVNTYLTLVRLIQGSISAEAVSGPVGIVHVGTKAASRGFSWLLFFLGLISVNLAVINFLPIPVLDGGHVVFLLIEKIKGAPPSAGLQNAAMFAGLALLGCVMLLVTYNDIARIITGG